MKRLLFVAPVALALVGCGGDISSVKNGTMEFNQTITLGKALDSWKSCEDREWDEFETDNGIKVVQFSCFHKTDKFMSKLKSFLPPDKITETDHLDVISNVQVFQFTLNQDDTFQIDNVQVETVWEDGSYFEDSQQPVEQLENAYSDTLNFDPAELNQMSAIQMNYFFGLIKSRAG